MKHYPKIEVRRKWGIPELYMDGFPQSTLSYRRDWYRVLKKTLTWGMGEPQVLLLGLGGGDIVRVLTKHNPNTKITAVEIQADILPISREYFGVEEGQSLVIKIIDANDFMKKNITQFDIVIVDLYSGDQIPKFVNTFSFLGRARTALFPGGQVVVNYASHSFQEIDFMKFESKIGKVFGDVQRVVVWGHTFYLANKL